MAVGVRVRAHGASYQNEEGFAGHCKGLTFISRKMEAIGWFGTEMRLTLKRITVPAVLRG